METLKEDGKFQHLEQAANAYNSKTEDDEKREIVKEIKEIKRQNFITQFLVSALIVLTVTWQLSEVSLILKVKNGISHPFKSFGTMLKGVLKGPNLSIGQNGDNNNNKHNNHTNQHEIGGTLVPPITVPELPHLGFNDHDKH